MPGAAEKIAELEAEEEKIAKVALVMAAKAAIKNGLGLLGMNAPEKM